MTEDTSRRERKKLKTRLELVAAARQLIADGGVADLRVADITAKVDVALGTFYSYFETKDDVVEAVVAEVLGPFADAAGDYGDQAEDPAVAMSVAIQELARICATAPDIPRLLVRLDDASARFERIVWHRAEPLITRAIDSGRFRVAGNDPEFVVRVVLAAVFAMLRAREGTGVDLDPQDAALLGLQLVGIDHDEALAISSLKQPELAVGAAV